MDKKKIPHMLIKTGIVGLAIIAVSAYDLYTNNLSVFSGEFSVVADVVGVFAGLFIFGLSAMALVRGKMVDK